MQISTFPMPWKRAAKTSIFSIGWANDEFQSRKTRPDRLDGVHIIAEKSLADFQALADGLLGPRPCIVPFPPVEGLIEASAKMVDGAEAGGEQHEVPVLAADLLLSASQEFPETAVQQIKARVSGHTDIPVRFQELKVLLLSLSPEKQIVDVLDRLSINTPLDIVLPDR